MEKGQGMVAVVRGLTDNQLAVTLLDSGKQYTLLPNSALQPLNGQQERSSNTSTPYRQVQQLHQAQVDAAAQATDGRYASVYKTTHCKMRPTSPPVQLTEFPPQRVAVAPGQGNFEVGGAGSGDIRYNATRANGCFRGGGMVWPDRGSVCTPRPSREPDAFAESLRRYPSISPERSAEIVERLINYTQGKNYSKPTKRQSTSPTRTPSDQNEKTPRGSRCRACDFEKTRYRYQTEYPTRDRSRKPERLDSDGESRKSYSKNVEMRYVKEVTRRLKDPKNPYASQCPSVREAFEMMNNNASNSTAAQKPSPGARVGETSRNQAFVEHPVMVHSMTQAAAPMVCKEVSTDSRQILFSRNVAVPLSPHPSRGSHPPEGAVFDPHPLLLQASVQTLVIPIPITVRKSVQTTQSSIDICSVRSTKDIKICRSEIEVSNKVRKEILGWLVDVWHSTYSKNLRSFVIEKMEERIRSATKGVGGDEAKVKLKVKSIENAYPKNNLQDICDELVNKVRIKNRYCTQIYRAKVIPYRPPEEFKKAIKDWLLELPLRTTDYCGTYIDEEKLLTNFVKRLKKALFNSDYDTIKLKNEIVKILNDVPIYYESENPDVYLNRLANNLLNKLMNANYYSYKNETFTYEVGNNTANKNVCPHENEIKDLVRDEILDFVQKCHVTINSEQLNNIETYIISRVSEYLKNKRPKNSECLIEDVAHALQSIGVSKHQASRFANLLLDHLNELLTKAERSERDQTRRSQMLMVLNSTANDTADYTREISETDEQNSLESYIQNLTQQIDEWLAGLELQIPWSQDESFRQVVVNDLAEDIIDRQKYLKLNPDACVSKKDELEYLKYLIYKWINKLVGEDNQDTIEHAPELMRRIRSVPVPHLTKFCQILPTTSPESSHNHDQMATLGPGEGRNMFSTCYTGSTNVQAYPVPIAGPSRIENPAAATNTGQPNLGMRLEDYRARPGQDPAALPNLEQLNKNYEDFVRAWVQRVPLPSSTPEEEATSKKLRVGIYNGIFHIVNKLKFEKQLLFDPVFYQDAFEQELDTFFTMIPQTKEFQIQKHQLKVEMVDKTTELNEVMKFTAAPKTFKMRIFDKYRDYVPRLSTDMEGECPLRLYEELQILNIAEDFIVFTKYKEEDPNKAYIYRQRLNEHIKEFTSEMKRLHGQDLRDINPEVYMEEVMEALQQVPLPSDEDLEHEADEILLGRAIEEWYMALPIAHNDNLTEQLKRRRLRDKLTMKIHEMENSFIATGNTPDHELRQEISGFLGKIPLGRDESLNINQMVDALVNKVKNRATLNNNVAALYNSLPNYSDFSGNVALNSSREGYQPMAPLDSCCVRSLEKLLGRSGPSGMQQGLSATQMYSPGFERQHSMIGGGPPLRSLSGNSPNGPSEMGSNLQVIGSGGGQRKPSMGEFGNTQSQSPGSSSGQPKSCSCAKKGSSKVGKPCQCSKAGQKPIGICPAASGDKPCSCKGSKVCLCSIVKTAAARPDGQTSGQAGPSNTQYLGDGASLVDGNFPSARQHFQQQRPRTEFNGQTTPFTSDHTYTQTGGSMPLQGTTDGLMNQSLTQPQGSIQAQGGTGRRRSTIVRGHDSVPTYDSSHQLQTQGQIPDEQQQSIILQDYGQAQSPGPIYGQGQGYFQGLDNSQGQVQGYSPGQVQGYSPGLVQGYSPAQVQGYSPGLVQGYSPGPVQGYSPGQVQGYVQGQVLDQSYGQSQSYGPLPGQAQGQVYGQDQVQGQVPGPSYGQSQSYAQDQLQGPVYSQSQVPASSYGQSYAQGQDPGQDQGQVYGQGQSYNQSQVMGPSYSPEQVLGQSYGQYQGQVQGQDFSHVQDPSNSQGQSLVYGQGQSPNQFQSQGYADGVAYSPDQVLGQSYGQAQGQASGPNASTATDTEDRAKARRKSLVHSGPSRTQRSVSIVTPPSEERMRQLPNASTSQGLPVQPGGTYEEFETGQPLSSSFNEQNIGNVTPGGYSQPQLSTSMPSRRQTLDGTIQSSAMQSFPNIDNMIPRAQESGYAQPQLNTSMQSRRQTLDGQTQQSPMQSFMPSVMSSMSSPRGAFPQSRGNVEDPQWLSMSTSGPQQFHYQTPPGPQRMSVAGQRTMYDPNQSQMFAPGSPGQMIGPGQMVGPAEMVGPSQMVGPGQMISSGMVGRPYGSLPAGSQGRQMVGPGRMSVPGMVGGPYGTLISGSPGGPMVGPGQISSPGTAAGFQSPGQRQMQQTPNMMSQRPSVGRLAMMPGEQQRSMVSPSRSMQNVTPSRSQIQPGSAQGQDAMGRATQASQVGGSMGPAGRSIQNAAGPSEAWQSLAQGGGQQQQRGMPNQPGPSTPRAGPSMPGQQRLFMMGKESPILYQSPVLREYPPLDFPSLSTNESSVRALRGYVPDAANQMAPGEVVQGPGVPGSPGVILGLPGYLPGTGAVPGPSGVVPGTPGGVPVPPGVVPGTPGPAPGLLDSNIMFTPVGASGVRADDVIATGFRPGQPGQPVYDPRGYNMQPGAISTPLHQMAPNAPRRGRRARGDLDGNIDDARRQLDLSDTDSDIELRLRCRCFDRFRRLRNLRRGLECDLPRYECDVPCPNAYYYYRVVDF